MKNEERLLAQQYPNCAGGGPRSAMTPCQYEPEQCCAGTQAGRLRETVGDIIGIVAQIKENVAAINSILFYSESGENPQNPMNGSIEDAVRTEKKELLEILGCLSSMRERL